MAASVGTAAAPTVAPSSGPPGAVIERAGPPGAVSQAKNNYIIVEFILEAGACFLGDSCFSY